MVILRLQNHGLVTFLGVKYTYLLFALSNFRPNGSNEHRNGPTVVTTNTATNRMEKGQSIHVITGKTESEIAIILRVGKTTVDRDLVYLRKQAQENIKSYYPRTVARTISKRGKPGPNYEPEYCHP
jgi:hypothetical protein